MSKNCLSHQGVPAVTMCNQCHRPICKSCLMVTPHGSFCSSECSVIFREFKEKMKAAPAKSGGGIKQLVLFVAVLVVVAVGIHVAARFGGVEAARKFDVLGKFLKTYEAK